MRARQRTKTTVNGGRDSRWSSSPYVVVPGTQPKVPVKFEYADESDPGPYPIPRDAPIEGARSPRATVMSW